MQDQAQELLQYIPVIVNIGVLDFSHNLQTQGAQVIQVDWSPPASGDEEILTLLDKLL